MCMQEVSLCEFNKQCIVHKLWKKISEMSVEDFMMIVHCLQHSFA